VGPLVSRRFRCAWGRERRDPRGSGLDFTREGFWSRVTSSDEKSMNPRSMFVCKRIVKLM
jgi:hypothetical protein